MDSEKRGIFGRFGRPHTGPGVGPLGACRVADRGASMGRSSRRSAHAILPAGYLIALCLGRLLAFMRILALRPTARIWPPGA
ncbi:uncharacterized protein VTP21DRAFT_7001 [Calcarisporiella thermophila]|uniref:uncharacterized protein n=1 Tax=Calcarisporiella thermophila TaxID=911321 RepID=UPI0037421008